MQVSRRFIMYNVHPYAHFALTTQAQSTHVRGIPVPTELKKVSLLTGVSLGGQAILKDFFFGGGGGGGW